MRKKSLKGILWLIAYSGQVPWMQPVYSFLCFWLCLHLTFLRQIKTILISFQNLTQQSVFWFVNVFGIQIYWTERQVCNHSKPQLSIYLPLGIVPFRNSISNNHMNKVKSKHLALFEIVNFESLLKKCDETWQNSQLLEYVMRFLWTWRNVNINKIIHLKYVR